MKKYEVTLYYHTSVTVEVEAKNEEDAIANAYAEAGDSKYDNQFLNNVQEDGSTGPHVTESRFKCPGNCAECVTLGCGCWTAQKGDTILFEAH